MSLLTKKASIYSLTLFFLLIFAGISHGAQIVRLPITIEYELLRNMIVERAFTGPNESVQVVNEGGGCISLVLSKPQVAEERGVLRLSMDLFVRGGTPIGGKCLMPLGVAGGTGSLPISETVPRGMEALLLPGGCRVA